MKDEVYAFLEITKKDIRFVVGKYREHLGLKIIFKERFKGNWLDDNDVVLDISSAKLKLVKAIKNYENTFNQKIINVGIIYPVKTLKIANASPYKFIKNERSIVTSEDIKSLYIDAKSINENEFTKVINVRPYEFLINNKERRANIKPGFVASSISMMAKVYTITKEVYDSHEQVVRFAGKNILTRYFQTYVLAKQCIDEIHFKEPAVVVDWNTNSLDISFFTRETLIKRVSRQVGINQIISNIAQKINAKNKVVEMYLFKMLNFGSNKSDGEIIYRKYVNTEKKTIEINAKLLKQLILEEIFYIIDLVDLDINKEFSKVEKDFKIYFNGKITELSGIEKIITRSKFKNKVFIYYSLVTGANQIWSTSLCGAIKTCHYANKVSKIFKTSLVEIDKNQYNLNRQDLNNKNSLNNQVPTNQSLLNPILNQRFNQPIINNQRYVANPIYQNQNGLNNQQNHQNINNLTNQNGIIKKQTSR
ncbi:cell division protein FtsA [Spiroplasma gladiatoris]|uniref:Cell division protein FtsA n=1 Tax=Spiroplasma gladiatoris TaxID=2143 RepID=A0A4P7AI63_9MOLU|nr:hypothetical protein [Spiroplasma gladiatoris]QBQ07957.1 cell division protein FtsA [Spiroplasma gladiatoris]